MGVVRVQVAPGVHKTYHTADIDPKVLHNYRLLVVSLCHVMLMSRDVGVT